MIKKHYKFIIFLLIFLLIFIIYQTNHKNYINYTSLGDGYALGINSYGIIDYGYSDYIKDDIEQKNELKLYTKEFSKKDQSITNLYQEILTNKKIKIDTQEINLRQIIRESNIITMTIGLNDITYNIAITEEMTEQKLDQIIEDTYKDFTKLINEIAKYYPKKLIIVGYPNIPIQDYYLKLGLEKWNEKVKTNKKIIYIDTKDIIEEEDFLKTNSKYPSTKSYQKIASKVQKRLVKQQFYWYTNNAMNYYG